MNTFEVEVEGQRYEIRTSSMGEAAKQGILAYCTSGSGKAERSEVSLTVRVKQTPRVRRVG